MAEDDDKPGQDATIQVSGSELEVLRQSAQLVAVNRDSIEPQLRDETTLDLELKGTGVRAEATDDDSTKAINRQSLVQIIKTEINASNPGGEVKPFGIMRRDERAAPSSKMTSGPIVQEPSEDHSDQTQAIGKEELKLLRQSQNIRLDELPPPQEATQAPALAVSEPQQSGLTQAELLDETTLLQRPELGEDELPAQAHWAPKAPGQAHQAPLTAQEDEPSIKQAQVIAPKRARSPVFLLMVVMLSVLVTVLLLVGLDVISF